MGIVRVAKDIEAGIGGVGLAWTVVHEINPAILHLRPEEQLAAFLVFALTTVHGIVTSDHQSQNQTLPPGERPINTQ